VLQYEHERASIAREIHDDLAQKLTVAGMELSLWHSDVHDSTGSLNREAVLQKISELGELLNSAVDAARAVTTSLRSRTLESFGIAAAIEGVVARFRARTGIVCDYRQGRAIDMHADVAVQVLRVIEAFLSQCHSSSCTSVVISTSAVRNGLQVRMLLAGGVQIVPGQAAALVRVFGGKLGIASNRVTMWFPTQMPV